MNIEAHFRKFDDLAKKVIDLTSRIPTTTPDETLYRTTVVFFLVRGYRTFQSAYLLCVHGQVDSATILARVLFEISVNLLYICKEPLEHSRLFFEYDSVASKGILDKLIKTVSDPERLRAIKSAESGLAAESERLKVNYPNRWRWSGKTIKQMAEEVGLGWHYDHIYWPQSNLAHPSPTIMGRYLSVNAKEIVIGAQFTDDDLSLVWLSSCRWLITILDKVNTLFDLKLESKIAEAKDYLPTDI
ncbi:MAG: hypothetical protein HZA21_03135 [Nitrospirae bacterium]|nr:hypothetical protein [Nitrospirota bacterium]